MYLVQVFLPTCDRSGQPLPREPYDQIRAELAQRHGGARACLRTSLHAMQDDAANAWQREDLVLIEVMCERLDRTWWHDYRRGLEQMFDQREVLLRALGAERL